MTKTQSDRQTQVEGQLENIRTVLFKTVKVMRNKGSLRDCRSSAEAKETWSLNAGWDPGGDLQSGVWLTVMYQRGSLTLQNVLSLWKIETLGETGCGVYGHTRYSLGNFSMTPKSFQDKTSVEIKNTQHP